MNKPRILLYDIETQPILAFVWELWETDVIKVVEPWEIICFSYKWLGERDVHVVSIPMVKTEKRLIGELWKLLNEADIVIAHNGDNFDNKKTFAKFVEFGFNPPKPFKTVDTLKVARKYFKFYSNRLDSLGEYLGLGRKVKTGGFDLWDKCMKGDKKAWRLMEKYNKQDVILLEKVYYKLRPFIKQHPNLNMFKETNHSCPNCGSKNMQRRGYSYSRTTKYQRWQCQSCFSWHQSTINPHSTIK